MNREMIDLNWLTCPRRAPQYHRLNHPSTNTFAGRCVVSCQARSRPRAVGTLAAVLFAGWHAPLEALKHGTIAANPRLRRGAAVASSRSVGSSSSNPSPCWRQLDLAEPRPGIRFCRQRFRSLHRGSVVAQHSTTLIQLGGCFPSITHKDLTSISGGRFIRSSWIVAFPTSVSPTMRVPLTDQSKCSSH